MANAFLTKKQQKQVKERRRKKKLALTTLDPSTNNNDTTATNTITTTDEQQTLGAELNGKKRPRQAEALSPILETITVTIPANSSPKNVRKLRKDARRQARSEGRDDAQIQFVVEGEEPAPQQQQQELINPPSKKPKRAFACINELVQQEKLLQEQRAKQIKEDNLPDEHKAQFVALDCEMVGIGRDGKQSALARVSMVDWWGKTLIDTFVQVPTKVTDFRTFVSGVEPKHIQPNKAMEVNECRKTVSNLLKDKILVGHALKNDLHALMLQHPRDMIRDTAQYRPFQRYHKKWRPRKLRDLVKEHCNLTIQVQGESHDSVDDANATMELYKTVQTEWEKELQLKKTKLTKKAHR